MNKPFTYSLEGMDKVLKGLKSLPVELKKKAEMEIKASAEVIARNAKRDAIVDNGFLKNGISSFKVGEMTFEVVSNAHYSAYVEFGTGGLVDIPNGLESYAAQFKGDNKRKVNLPARPFLFNNFYAERTKLINRLKKIINEL